MHDAGTTVLYCGGLQKDMLLKIGKRGERRGGRGGGRGREGRGRTERGRTGERERGERGVGGKRCRGDWNTFQVLH